MNTVNTEFTTKKTLKEIVGILKSFAASEKRTNIEELEEDPLDALDGSQPEIAILISGQKSALSWAELWGVQVVVWDQGDYREIDLVALGNGLGERTIYVTYYMLGQSKKMMKKLAELLK